jgi:hypothetical protein
MKIQLFLPGYLTPSLNKTQHAHWRVSHREKRKAIRALWSALHDAVRAPSTGTTSMDQSSISLMHAAEAGLSLEILSWKSTSKSNSKGLLKHLKALVQSSR